MYTMYTQNADALSVLTHNEKHLEEFSTQEHPSKLSYVQKYRTCNVVVNHVMCTHFPITNQ